MTIHTTHPFADADRDPARRFRGHVTGAVTLWTSGSDVDRAGLTVSSAMVALGPEPTVLALLDPDSDLVDTLRGSGRGIVQLLSWSDRGLAEAFAGTAPAPGGPFRQATFVQQEHGPLLATATTWAGVRLMGERDMGWSVEVACVLERIEVGDDVDPLLHRRGRFFRVS